MAKSRSPGTDKFRVGQVCMLVLEDDPRYRRYSGTRCVVTKGRRAGKWPTIDLAGRHIVQGGRRYEVEYAGGLMNVYEYMLRPIYDGESLSTWAQFEKVTGIQIWRSEPANG